MFEDWRILLPLLEGTHSKELIDGTFQAILDILTEDDLSEIFHRIIFEYLIHQNEMIRKNGSELLKVLCEKYRSNLSRLLSLNHSDGELFLFSDLDIEKLIQSNITLLKYGSGDNAFNHNIYQKSWLQKQKKFLIKHISKSSGVKSKENILTKAYEFDFDLNIDQEMVHEGSKEVNCSKIEPLRTISEIDVLTSKYREVDDETQETWLTRQFRYLLLSLLHENWEVRHGAGLGLHSILQGLSSHSEDFDLSFLPRFLLSDILCIGFCVIILDNFFDSDFFSENKTIESNEIMPVKSTISKLIVLILKLTDDNSTVAHINLTEFLQKLSLVGKSSQDWKIQFGLYVLIKEIIENIFFIQHLSFYIQFINTSFDDLSLSEISLLGNECFYLLYKQISSLQLNQQQSSFIMETIEKLYLKIFETEIDFKSHGLTLFSLIETIFLFFQFISNDVKEKGELLIFQLIHALSNILFNLSSSKFESIIVKIPEIISTIHNITKVIVSNFDIFSFKAFIMSIIFYLNNLKNHLLIKDTEKIIHKVCNDVLITNINHPKLFSILNFLDCCEIIGYKLFELLFTHSQLFETFIFVLIDPQSDIFSLSSFFIGLSGKSNTVDIKDIYLVFKQEIKSTLEKLNQLTNEQLISKEDSEPKIKKRRFTIASSSKSMDKKIDNNQQGKLLSNLRNVLLTFNLISSCGVQDIPNDIKLFLNESNGQFSNICVRLSIEKSLEVLIDYLFKKLFVNGCFNISMLSGLDLVTAHYLGKLKSDDFISLSSSSILNESSLILFENIFISALSLNQRTIKSENELKISFDPTIEFFLTGVIKEYLLSSNVIYPFDSINNPFVNQRWKIQFYLFNKYVNLLEFNKVIEYQKISNFKVQMVQLIFQALVCESFENLDIESKLFHTFLVIDSLNALSLQSESEVWEFIGNWFLKTLFTLDLALEANLSYHAYLFGYITQTYLDSISLFSFDSWINICIKGIADFDEVVRYHCTRSFRLIIPLVPVSLNFIKKKNLSNESSNSIVFNKSTFIKELLSKSYLIPLPNSNEALDLMIMHLYNLTLKSHPSLLLRSYQWEGVSWLTRLRRCGLSGILADEMGLGKSIQAITFLLIIRLESFISYHELNLSMIEDGILIQKKLSQKRLKSISSLALIVCPASLCLHWKEEFSKHFDCNPFLRPMVLDGQSFSEPAQKFLPSFNILIVSYESLKKNIKWFQEAIWECIILDEAHLIRNPKSNVAQAIFSLKSWNRLALTGTPIQNKIEDIWSISNFLIPDYLGNYSEFQVKYVIPIKKSMQIINLLSNKSLDSNQNLLMDKEQIIKLSTEGVNLLKKLHKQILPFVLRREKFEVLQDLPSKTIVDILCPLTMIQSKLYKDFLQSYHISEDDLVDRLKRNNGSERNDVELIDSEIVELYDDLLDSLRSIGPLNSLETKSRKSNMFALIKCLQLLSIHPSLILSSQHHRYQQKLNDDITSSGKILCLARLLLDSNILQEKDFESFDSQENRRINYFEFYSLISKSETGEMIEDNNRIIVESTFLDSSESDSESDFEDPDNSEIGDNSKSEIKNEIINTFNQITLSKSKKCLIFVQHAVVLDLLENFFFKKYFPNVRYARLDGGVPPDRRFLISQEFNSTVETQNPLRILILSTRSCSLGLNLIAADTVIFLEHDWNPFVDIQAMDRAHRIGQINPVTVYRLIANSPIDAHIQGLQDWKQNMASEVISGSSSRLDENHKKIFDSTTKDENYGHKLWESLTTIS